MNKNVLAQVLDEVLLPRGFVRKGNYWVEKKGEIIKMINLQKSEFANHFYINYGFRLKKLPLGNLSMHVYNRLASPDPTTANRILLLLDLDSELPDLQRSEELATLLQQTLLPVFEAVNSDDDLRAYLMNRPNLNAVPIVVKDYLELSN